MSGETQTTLIGNIVDDPELRFTPSGAAVCNFRVASTPRKFNRQSNQWEDQTGMFISCAVWRQQAENCAESLRKGMRVVVLGNLIQEEWDDRNGGGKRSAIKMDVIEVGPSLAFATANVTRAGRGNGGGQQQGSGGGGQERPGQQGGDPWAQPQGGADPWGPPSGQTEPPF